MSQDESSAVRVGRQRAAIDKIKVDNEALKQRLARESRFRCGPTFGLRHSVSLSHGGRGGTEQRSDRRRRRQHHQTRNYRHRHDDDQYDHHDHDRH